MTSTIKVNNIQNQCGANIINENSNTITLGASGDTIALASGASQSGFGRTGTVDWDTTPKTATFSAVSGDGFFCNTTSSAFTANLPAGVAGAIVSFADYAGTWQTNALTVSPNGSDKIGGTNANVTLNTEGQSVTFIFADSTQGWINVQDSTSNERGNAFIVASGGNTVTTCGNFKIHTFTGPGTFTVSCTAVSAPDNVVDYLVVAGGGGGGHDNGGGGGAGGFRASNATSMPAPLTSPLASPTGITVTATAFPISVGGGGAGGTSGPGGTNGNNSIFSTITSTGGGGGGSTGKDGGSGGGSCSPGNPAGSGNTPPVSPPQGNNGATRSAGAPSYAGGGGGGAGAVGGNPTGPTGGSGGDGSYSNINTATGIADGPVSGARYYAGGGASQGQAGTAGSGGAGGGAGAGGSPHAAVNAVDNAGGGGEGGKGCSQPACGSNGGSGIVIIRYKFQ
jgi:hypothetical protein